MWYTMIDFKTVISRLDENQMLYTVVDLGNNANIIITQYGGRILGPFLNGGPSLTWINPCLNSKDSFESFCKQKEWNLGGDRIWLAPENQYNVPDENDFWGSYTVPAKMDPGNYTLTENQYGQSVLSQDMTLEVFRQTAKEKELNIERMIKPVGNPLGSLDDSCPAFFGYEHQIMLSEKANDGVKSEAWNQLQFSPVGTLYIPTTASAKYTEYYDSIEEGYQAITPTHVELKIDAKKSFKVGYKSVFTIGRTGYISSCGDDSYLMIRSFGNDISGDYLKHPTGRPDESGHALHVYHDDGGFGQFAEHECSCTPIGGNCGRGMSMDRIYTMFYVGEIEKLHSVKRMLLGI